MTVLDEQAQRVLRSLKPGDRFTLRGDSGTVIECREIRHPVEGEPVVRGYVVHRGGILGSFRSPGISRVDRILPKG